jgi:hypothetical protein
VFLEGGSVLLGASAAQWLLPVGNVLGAQEEA